jgi:hypothetical protein
MFNVHLLSGRRVRIVISSPLVAAFAMFGCALTMIAVGASRPNHIPPPLNTSGSAGQRLRLEISPNPISLGLAGPGRSASAVVALVNPGSLTLALTQVETTCSCVSVSAVPVLVAPGATTKLEVAFDPSDDPDFRGNLAVDILGRGLDDVVLFRATVLVSVAKKQVAPPLEP